MQHVSLILDILTSSYGILKKCCLSMHQYDLDFVMSVMERLCFVSGDESKLRVIVVHLKLLVHSHPFAILVQNK